MKTITRRTICSNTGVRNSNIMPTRKAVHSAEIPLMAPASLLTALLEKEPVIGYAPNIAPMKLDIPRPINS